MGSEQPQLSSPYIREGTVPEVCPSTGCGRSLQVEACPECGSKDIQMVDGVEECLRCGEILQLGQPPTNKNT
jgi:hypothetical protein